MPIENEIFEVYFLDCRESHQIEIMGTKYKKLKTTKTDKRGHFSMKLETGEYCIMAVPGNITDVDYMDSMYARDPYPGCSSKKHRIRIDKGKITVVKKIMKYGGSISLKFINEKGNKIDFKKLPCKHFPINFIIFKPKTTCSHEVSYNYYLKDSTKGYLAKKFVNNIYPGKYTGIIYFDIEACKKGLAYGYHVVNEILIEPTKDSLLPVIIDENTGIEFSILDDNNKPIKNTYIKIEDYNNLLQYNSNDFYFKSTLDCRTDENGKCEILNLLPSITYKVYISKNGYESKMLEKIKVRKGKIKRLEIVLNSKNK